MPKHTYRYTHLVNLPHTVGACLCLHQTLQFPAQNPRQGLGPQQSLLIPTTSSPAAARPCHPHQPDQPLSEFLGSQNQACRLHSPAQSGPFPLQPHLPNSPLFSLYSRHNGLFAAWLFFEHTGHSPALGPLHLLFLMLSTFSPQLPPRYPHGLFPHLPLIFAQTSPSQ